MLIGSFACETPVIGRGMRDRNGLLFFQARRVPVLDEEKNYLDQRVSW